MKAFGYIDPGTGSFILQAIIGVTMGVLYFVRSHLKMLFSWLRHGKKKSSPTTNEKSE